MTKQIESIWVNRKHANKTYISVNFGSRYSAGNITFDKITKKYSYENLTEEQLAEARSLAFNPETKKWENWKRNSQPVNFTRDQDDEVLANEEAARFYSHPQVPPAEPEIFG